MKNTNKILIVVVLLIIALFAIQKELVKDGAEDMVVLSFSSPENIETFGSAEIESFIDFTTQFEEEFNRDIEDLINEFGEDSVESYRFDDVYNIYENDRFYSIAFNYYEYIGGAHGNTYNYSLVYDKEFNRVVSLADVAVDLFQESYNDLITRLYAKITEEEQDKIYSDLESQEKSDPQAWYISKDENDNWTLNTIFSPYAIGPFSSGTIEVDLTAED